MVSPLDLNVPPSSDSCLMANQISHYFSEIMQDII